MKNYFYSLLAMATLLVVLVGCNQSAPKPQKVLRHVVLFGFDAQVSGEQIKEVETAFSALPQQIDGIKAYEWGTDCSPEGLQQGHTHCFFLTFESEKDRDAYLVHPAHQKFGQLVQGKLKHVTVVDYWVQAGTTP